MSNEIEKDIESVLAELKRVKDHFKITAAKLMVANQTVHELLKGHMDLRAALSVSQPEKSGLEEYYNSLMNPQAAEAAPAPAETAPEVVQDDCVNDNVPANADTVSA